MYRAFRDQTSVRAEAIKALERCNRAGDRRRRLPLVDEVLHIAADALAVALLRQELLDLTQVSRELPKITHVRGDRVRRCVFHIQKKTFIRRDEINHLTYLLISNHLRKGQGKHRIKQKLHGKKRRCGENRKDVWLHPQQRNKCAEKQQTRKQQPAAQVKACVPPRAPKHGSAISTGGAEKAAKTKGCRTEQTHGSA